MQLTVLLQIEWEKKLIIQYKDLIDLREKYKNKNISICTGTFDLFHYSHLMLLKYIKEHSDILVVVVKCDKDVKSKGTNRPIINEYERAIIVDNIKYTDYTIISSYNYKTPLIDKLIEKNNYTQTDIYKLKRDGFIFEKLRPNVLYVTDDKKVSKGLLDICKEINTKVEIIPIQGNNFHTSDIIKKIISNK